MTECDEWIRSCGVVLGEDSKRFVLTLAVVILVRKVFLWLARLR